MRRAAVLALLLIVAACGGGGGGDDTKSASSDDLDATSTTAVVEDGETTTTAAGDTATTVAAARAGSTTTVATDAPAAGGPAPVPAGTYHYKQSGSATFGTQKYDTPPEGTAVVKEADADGVQLVQRYVDPNGEPTDTTFQFRPDGIFILQTVIRQGGQEITCTFGRGIPAPPWPPTVGATGSGHGECGQFTTDVTTKITGTKPVSIDGGSYTAYVIESTLTTKGQLESSGTQIDWFVPELRVSTHTETHTTGKFGTFTFSADGTSDLVSAKPDA